MYDSWGIEEQNKKKIALINAHISKLETYESEKSTLPSLRKLLVGRKRCTRSSKNNHYYAKQTLNADFYNWSKRTESVRKDIECVFGKLKVRFPKTHSMSFLTDSVRLDQL